VLVATAGPEYDGGKKNRRRFGACLFARAKSVILLPALGTILFSKFAGLAT